MKSNFSFPFRQDIALVALMEWYAFLTSCTPKSKKALVIQSQSATALGQGGSGLGYQGIRKSVAVEFDTYKNTDDLPAPHIRFDFLESLV